MSRMMPKKHTWYGLCTESCEVPMPPYVYGALLGLATVALVPAVWFILRAAGVL